MHNHNETSGIVCDIETEPHPDAPKFDRDSVEPPATYKSAEAIEKWFLKAEAGYNSKLQLYGDTGKVIAIGYLKPYKQRCNIHTAFTVMREKSIVKEFWNRMLDPTHEHHMSTVIGYNFGFDFDFLLLRARILDIDIVRGINEREIYRRIIDVYERLTLGKMYYGDTFAKGRGKLPVVAKTFRVNHKFRENEVSGELFAEYLRKDDASEQKLAFNHLRADLLELRGLARRLGILTKEPYQQ